MKRASRIHFFIALVSFLAACAHSPTGRTPVRRLDDALLYDVTVIYDTRSGERTTLDALIREASRADAVFVGETHLDEVTHRLELAIYDGLLKARGGKTVLAMEMFSRADQPALDNYTSGKTDEAAFLDAVTAWGNYDTGYRPLIERARVRKHPVVGSNLPRDVSRKIAQGGKEAYEELRESARADLVPAKLFENSPAYWERFERTVRSHAHMIMGDENERIYSTQSLWDNTMGESCARALDAHPGYNVVHVNGGFHSAYRQGTVEQFLARKPKASVVTIDIRPTDDPFGTHPREPTADFVIFAHARGRGLKEGRHAVHLGREVEMRLHVPERGHSEALPLLVWLSPHGTRPEDASQYWTKVLGEDAIVVVLDMPYKQLEPQLFVGGRWFWTETFSEDVSSAGAVIDRAIGYVDRYWKVDPERVVVAGRSEGATVVVAAALYSGDSTAFHLALEPRGYTKLRELPLPDSPVTAPLVVQSEDEKWWTRELTDYAGIGFDAKLEPVAGVQDAVRTALGFSPVKAEPLRVRVQDTSPLCRDWAQLYAVSQDARRPIELAEREGVALAFPGESDDAVFSAEVLVAADHIPLAPNPFGGTTVVVLPPDVPKWELDMWRSFESRDILTERTRFYHLRVAEWNELSVVLTDIRDMGRAEVLIVPAVFCASTELMRDLERQAGTVERLNVSWLPGLGADASR